MQQLSTRDRVVRRESTVHDSSRISIASIADLLSSFDGSVGGYKVWEMQLKLIKTSYRLPDEHVKILIGMRLKGKASEWLHSTPQHVEQSLDAFLDEIREMYDHRPSKMLLRKTIRRACVEKRRDIPSVRARKSDPCQPCDW